MATPAKRVGYYFIAGSVLTEYKAPATVDTVDVISDWTRTRVTSAENGYIKLIIESIASATNVITINTLVVPVPVGI